ncbi:MAG TPA: hypothetical protein VFX70_12720 [Mycobacteriales bacterium]|nr:hypothetical protein [Mycobacteriales bacterium]
MNRKNRNADGRIAAEEEPHVVIEIRPADPAQAEQVRAEQARAIREVLEWTAQKRSERGRDRAA